jgi:hypothetical protein
MTAEIEVAGADVDVAAERQPSCSRHAGRPAFDETIAADVDRLLSDVDKEVKRLGKEG